MYTIGQQYSRTHPDGKGSRRRPVFGKYIGLGHLRKMESQDDLPVPLESQLHLYVCPSITNPVSQLPKGNSPTHWQQDLQLSSLNQKE